jgi:hypothetical protein
MDWLTDFMTIVVTLAVIATPAVAIAWALAGSDGFTLAELFRIASNESWPRGVQEEEPVHWKLEQIDRRSTGARPDPTAAPTGRPRPGLAASSGRSVASPTA